MGPTDVQELQGTPRGSTEEVRGCSNSVLIPGPLVYLFSPQGFWIDISGKVQSIFGHHDNYDNLLLYWLHYLKSELEDIVHILIKWNSGWDWIAEDKGILEHFGVRNSDDRMIHFFPTEKDVSQIPQRPQQRSPMKHADDIGNWAVK